MPGLIYSHYCDKCYKICNCPSLYQRECKTCTNCMRKHTVGQIEEQLTPEEEAVFLILEQIEEEEEQDRLEGVSYYFSHECDEGNSHSLCDDANCACPCHDVPVHI